MLSLPCLFILASNTQHPQERQWKMKDLLMKFLHLLLNLSLSKAWEHLLKSTVWRRQLSTDKHQCVCAFVCKYCECVLQENGICYGCLKGLGEFGGGGGGCSWGLCGGPLYRGATWASSCQLNTAEEGDALSGAALRDGEQRQRLKCWRLACGELTTKGGGQNQKDENKRARKKIKGGWKKQGDSMCCDWQHTFSNEQQ